MKNFAVSWVLGAKKNLFEEKHNYVNEKDMLLSRQDLLNKSLDFHDTERKINEIKQKMNELLSDDAALLTYEKIEERESLVSQLREETERLNELQLEIEDLSPFE